MNEAGVWNQLAGRYDLVVRLFDRSYPQVRRRIAADIPQGSHVLELAAGTGQFTGALAAAAESLVSTDISPEMVTRLSESVKASGLENVECAVMSAYEIDAPDGAFDVVFCANALHVMPEPERALDEFRRVLRKDGILIVPTFLHGAGPIRRAISRGLSLVSPFVAHTRFDLPALSDLITSHRFDVVSAEALPGTFPLAYVVARRSHAGA